MEEYEIKAVREVDGSVLKPFWKGKMQLVITDKGEFIDNIPGQQYGDFDKANKGYDWASLIGKKTKNVKIFKSSDYLWINYRENSDMEEKTPLS